jgi:hypothetical protein
VRYLVHKKSQIWENDGILDVEENTFLKYYKEEEVDRTLKNGKR